MDKDKRKLTEKEWKRKDNFEKLDYSQENGHILVKNFLKAEV